jgi:hypothetical protein
VARAEACLYSSLKDVTPLMVVVFAELGACGFGGARYWAPRMASQMRGYGAAALQAERRVGK